ncbi:MAG: hypothetical protein IT381_19400 [Deltaproteobacteria bacterium]|nr:hypothetical protein [Deltaproteobacteria bacterium]
MLPGAATLYMGDGVRRTIVGDGPVRHTFRFPGTKQLTLISDDGLFVAKAALVVQPLAHTITAVELALSGGTGADGLPYSGRLGVLGGPETLPQVTLSIRYRGPGEYHAKLVHTSADAVNTFTELVVPLPASQTGDEAVASVTTATVPVVVGTASIAVAGSSTSPVLLQLPPPSLAGDPCDEIRRQIEEMLGRIAAKHSDCDALRAQLADAQAALASAQATLAGLQTQHADLAMTKAGAEAEAAALAATIDRELAGVGKLFTYDDFLADKPAGNAVGGNGVGVSFEDAQALIDRSAEYKAQTGRGLLADARRLGKMKQDIAAMGEQLAALDAQIVAQQGSIAQQNANVAALETALADCESEAAQLELDLGGLKNLNSECLDAMRYIREAEEALRRARDKAKQADDARDAAGEARDDAGAAIDESAGSEGEKQGGRSDLGDSDGHKVAGDVKKAEAESGIDDAKKKLDEARALAGSDPDAAKAKATAAKTAAEGAGAAADDARDRYDDAKKEADDAKRDAESRPRECKEGETQPATTTPWIVWDQVIDMALAPHGSQSPEQWASTLKNAKGALDALKDFLDLLDVLDLFGDVAEKGGFETLPIGGTITPEADRALDAIFAAYMKIIENNYLFDVFFKLRGHTEWCTHGAICVNGRWSPTKVCGKNDDTIERTIKDGPIQGTAAEKREQMKEALTKIMRDHRAR